jgi:hypothetical protein
MKTYSPADPSTLPSLDIVTEQGKAWAKALTPATGQEIAALWLMMASYWRPDYTEAQTDLHVDLAKDDLADCPLWALKAAFKALRLNHKYPRMPNTADIRDALPQSFHSMRVNLERLRGIATRHKLENRAQALRDARQPYKRIATKGG